VRSRGRAQKARTESPVSSSGDKASEALVWRLRARVVYLRATSLGEREVEVSREWLTKTIEVEESLAADELAKKLSAASGGKLRVRAGKDAGLVVVVEAAAPIADVRRVFEFWQVQTSKTRSILDRKRERKIRDRLKEGYDVGRLEAAIRGALLDPFLRGENDRGKEYLDLSTILRDGPQVERLEALAEADGRRTGSVFRRSRR